MTGYSTIPATADPPSWAAATEDPYSLALWQTRDDRRPYRTIVLTSFIFVVAMMLFVLGATVGTTFLVSSGVSDSPLSPTSMMTSVNEGSSHLPMPHGVNLGSWLSLEDYFYVGRDGAVEVATPDDVVAAKCLPPLAVPARWNSETDLFASLSNAIGLQQAIQTFHAFRISYLDWDDELSSMAALGILHVRVPVSWCLTQHDPSRDFNLPDGHGYDNATLYKRYTCLDPFFEDRGVNVTWSAVPRPLLADFLRACSRYGIKATLDIHTYPGGTSIGTFSGVWPRQPLFWNYDNPENPETDVGRGVLRAWFTWAESLYRDDPESFSGLGAISPMNEPAHLAGLFEPGSAKPHIESFLPSLPNQMAQNYLKGLNENGLPTSVPNGPHLRVLLWLHDAVKTFRSSALPGLGIELHVNIHESILISSLVPTDANDMGGRHPEATSILASWWRSTTTSIERKTWAVLDMHHYHAWEPFCQGSVDGTGNYTCGDKTGTDDSLKRCASWAGMYRDIMDRHLGRGARLNSAEFSASTHHSVRQSCMDVTTLRKSYLAQVEAAKDANVDLYWWSWKMPHGGAFRPAWSFKHLLYLLGSPRFFRPDKSEIECVG